MSAENEVSGRTLAKGYFTSGWTPDSEDVICYRDYRYALISADGKEVFQGRIPNNAERADLATEWVSYSISLEAFVWSRVIDSSHGVLETPRRTIANGPRVWNGRVVPSPNGRYLAVFGEDNPSALRVYDLKLQAWTNLGGITVHPDTNWWYIQPDWNPWFADSSRLVFLSGPRLVVAAPDGKDKLEIPVEGPAGLPTPSPDGESVAYVAFDPRPRQVRSDLQFWGGTTIFVVSLPPGSKPRAVSPKNTDEVYDIKWLSNRALVFDRVADETFYAHTRIWRLAISR